MESVQRLLATSVLVTALAATSSPGPVLAQPAERPVQTGQASERRAFNISPQPLASALPLFGQQSGRQISANSDVVQGLSTPGIQGTMTVEEALRQLLAGTGLIYSGIGGPTIALQRPGAAIVPGSMQLDPVQVQGAFPVPSQAMIDNVPPPYAGGQVATGGQLGLLGNRGVMDTPFNQTSYTTKKAQDQQVRPVRDVLVDDPSVRSTFSPGTIGLDGVTIRGFNVGNTVTYGGLFGMLPSQSIMAEFAERIEVLKGPNAMLNGMAPGGIIGGTINVVPKRAPDEDLTQVTASYVSASQFGGHADIGRRFGDDKQFGVRFNGAFKSGQTDVQWNADQRALAALGLDFRGERVRFAADLGYQYQYVFGVTPYIGLANGVPLPWAPNVRSNPAAQPWNYRQNKDLFGVVRAEIDLAENVTAFGSFGAHDYRVEYLMGSMSATVTNFNGTATMTPVNQSLYFTYLTGEAGLRARFGTGPIGHELAFTGTTYSQENGSGGVNGTPFTTNIYASNVMARPNIATPAANKIATSGLSSLAIADTLTAADKRVQLTIGGRLQQVTATNFNTTTGAVTSSYDQSALTPAVALLFKPWERVSVYGNFIQGLQQGTIVPATFTNAGEIFPPYKSTQFEAGVKVDWGKFTTTANVFQITQPSTITDLATNTLVLGGEQRNQGLELNFFGEPTEGVRLLGGVMLLSAVLAKTQGGLTDGWIAPFSPAAQFNLGGEWDTPFAPGLTLNGRLVYTGTQYVDTTWPRRMIPDWTRVDIGARYAFENPGAKGKLLVARFNVENLFDNNYWASGLFVTGLGLGAPRTFRLSLTADF